MNAESNKMKMDLVKAVESWAISQPGLVALYFDEKTITFADLNVKANRVANGLQGLGVERGDRVAIMLPNIPEFVYSFVGILKLGAVAVPFNTLYKGGEIRHILKDSGAKVLIALTNFAPMINEIRPELPALKQVIITGERNLIFAHPKSTAFIQLIVPVDLISDVDVAYEKIGHILLDIVKEFGVKNAWYKHWGSIRVGGEKIATFVISQVETVRVINIVLFLAAMDVRGFLRVVWVPPEIRDKVVEPLTSVEQQTGKRPAWEEVKTTVTYALKREFAIEIKEGALVRDELFGYEKLCSLAGKVR